MSAAGHSPESRPQSHRTEKQDRFCPAWQWPGVRACWRTASAPTNRSLQNCRPPVTWCRGEFLQSLQKTTWPFDDVP